jgi:hypothetical protein
MTNLVLLCSIFLCIQVIAFAAKRRKAKSNGPKPRSPAFTPPSYGWEQVVVTKPKESKNEVVTDKISFETARRLGINQTSSVLASTAIGGKPVYVSIATISSRINQVAKTIASVLSGSMIPDHIYLFISKDPYILDKGIPNDRIPQELLEISYYYPFTIVYADNIGPHRKLLPLLAEKWNEDCIIITLDDEPQPKMKKYLSYMMAYYAASAGETIVTLRSRRIGFCDTAPWTITPYATWYVIHQPQPVQEFLLLPTGSGGVLYRPKFFHEVVFDSKFREITKAQDDLLFRLASMANDVSVYSGCAESKTKLRDKWVTIKCPDPMYFQKSLANNLKNDVSGSVSTRKLPSIADKRDQTIENMADAQNGTSSLEPKRIFIPLKTDKKRKRSIPQNSNSGKDDSLYTAVNIKGANDEAWKAALKYLSDTKKVFSLTSVVGKYIKRERGHCFGSNRGGPNRGSGGRSIRGSGNDNSSGSDSSSRDGGNSNGTEIAKKRRRLFAKKDTKACALQRCTQ